MKETYLSRDFRLRALYSSPDSTSGSIPADSYKTSKFYSKFTHRFFSDTSCKMTKRMV